jgi:polar amino acid transport system substrate-binding protein
MRLLAAVAVCATMALCAPCLAAQAKDIVMFIPNTDWPPYVINDPAHPNGGVLLSVFKAVVEPMGYAVEVRRLPNQRGWLLLDRGEVNVHAKAREWVANPDEYLWSDPFMTSETVMLYTTTSTLHYGKPEDFDGKSIAAIKGFIYPGLEEYFAQGKIERVDVASPFTMLELLSLGRVDAALVNRAETRWLMRNDSRLSPEKFRLDAVSCGVADYRFVFTRDPKWKPFIRQFNARLAAMKADGSLDAVLDRYR